jgi:hypothetical protein
VGVGNNALTGGSASGLEGCGAIQKRELYNRDCGINCFDTELKYWSNTGEKLIESVLLSSTLFPITPLSLKRNLKYACNSDAARRYTRGVLTYA